MDAFSQVLSSVQLQGALFFNAEFSAPWGFQSPHSSNLVPVLIPGASHLIIYHFLLDGTGFAELQDGRKLPLESGDIVIFPHGDPHRMWGGEPGHWQPDEEVMEILARRSLGSVCGGGGGDRTRFVCGYMACDANLCQSILTGLPQILKVNVRGDASGRWLENSIRHLVEEASSEQPGSDAMLAKLSEALFVDTLRRYMAALPEEESGWLAAARDPIVGKALNQLHSRVTEPWTLATLAREVGVSRSSLAERFARFLPEPPMTYLTRWRMQLGAKALLATSHSVAQVAAEVGYESEAAFNRAFKREFGEPPARFRKQKRNESQPVAATTST